uniref:Uncharacterized protein n=1 Tax=Panagrolaimus sp. ES5 TaxID=591445 RepID=A0AC34GVI2_9BILA
MVKILSSLKALHDFELQNLREEFEFSAFTDFLLKNKKVNVRISFKGNPPEEYKEKLTDFIHLVVENRPKKIPEICFRFYHNAAYEKLLHPSSNLPSFDNPFKHLYENQ